MIQQVASGANRMVNEKNPIVDARLEDGSRVNIILSKKMEPVYRRRPG